MSPHLSVRAPALSESIHTPSIPSFYLSPPNYLIFATLKSIDPITNGNAVRLDRELPLILFPYTCYNTKNGLVQPYQLPELICDAAQCDLRLYRRANMPNSILVACFLKADTPTCSTK
jgi:hypothetical protein